MLNRWFSSVSGKPKEHTTHKCTQDGKDDEDSETQRGKTHPNIIAAHSSLSQLHE